MVFKQQENNAYKLICQEVINFHNNPLALKATYQVTQFHKKQNQLILVKKQTFSQIKVALIYFHNLSNEMI